MADFDKYKIRNPEIRKEFNDIFTGEKDIAVLRADRIAISGADKTPVNAVASQGTLTVDTQPTAGDTMTIGTKEYTFTADGTADADGEIDIGANLAGAQTNIPAAINGSDSINDAHPSVTCAAFGTNDAVLTASTKGVAGDAIATTETFTAGTNVFDAATLGTTTAGVDGTAGYLHEICTDDSYLYVAVAANTIADANWLRVDLGSAY